VVDLPEYQIWLSGDVVVVRRDGILEVGGALTVPEASILVTQLPEEASNSSPDVVVIEDDAPDLLGLQMDLKIGFGDEVRVTAYGLDTGVTGQLQLKESPGRPQQVNGVLDLRDGTFAAYGQELVIQRGRLIFNGPIDNPTLDVVARRSVDSQGVAYELLLTLSGPADRISTKVSSRPLTTEADALALLITGRRLYDSSRAERVNLAGAAQVLGIKSASLLTDRIGGMLGVDEVIVEGDQENLEVGAAMQINPNLYLRYTYDVFSRLGGVLLNYQLTKSLSLHGKSGDSQSIHLNYEIDL
ncbi:MAG: translocation/assembly module TamB domain-containing protein, partial [Gammaproteobacteria bacterium]|nr:translocation/assembly module TamB domain-containing protein [Gammaproteobacteria bacterium]